jgi:plasmid stability protein
MPNLLIRNVSPLIVTTLKERARKRGRSVQAEALAALEAGATHSGDELSDEIARLRASGKLNLNVKAALAALLEDRAR